MLQLVIYLDAEKSMRVMEITFERLEYHMETECRHDSWRSIYVTRNMLVVVSTFFAWFYSNAVEDSNRRIGIEDISLADFIKLIRSPCYARPCVIMVAETLRGIHGSWKSCAFCGLDAPLSGLRYALVEKRIASANILF